MPFIKSFSINADRENPFPFNIPAVKFAKQIELDERITIFVGDNGSGKSTLLETIALSLNISLIGGYIGSSAGFEAARLLKPYLDIEWGQQTEQGFFFRAEDFSHFIDAVEREKIRIQMELHELKGEVNDSVIDKIGGSMNFTLRTMIKNYGSDMQAYSHGEAYLTILQKRIQDKGVYLLG
jgi:predicted ATPase